MTPQYVPDEDTDADEAIADDMTDSSAPPPAPETPTTSRALGAFIVDWRNLDADYTPGVWRRLRAWVEWVTVRYDIPVSTVPPCWWKHPALVEELSALHIAHTASFDSTDSGYGPLGWHERFYDALPRLTRAYAGGCARGHSDTKPRSWSDVTDESEWDAWTTTAHAHRDTHPGASQQEGRWP